MLKQFDTEADTIRENIFKIVWYMRGGINLDQAFMLNQKEQKIIYDIVSENIKNTEKSGMALL
jgi:predicted Zn-ribbon and HTH transcriptional regulator